MSEEKKKPEREISEAELTGVSGGVDDSYYEALARSICSHCTKNPLDPHHCAVHREHSLGPYLEEHGPDSVHKGNYKTNCPFYNL